MSKDLKLCQGCGMERHVLHKHHIIPRSLGGTNDPGNLLIICGACHDDIHSTEEGRRPWDAARSPEALAKRSATMKVRWKEGKFDNRKEISNEDKAKATKRLRQWYKDNPEKTAERNRKIARSKTRNKKIGVTLQVKWSEEHFERDTQIIKLCQNRVPLKEIETQMGISRQTLWKVRKQNGLV